MLKKSSDITTRRLLVVTRFLHAERVKTILQVGCSEPQSTLLFVREGFNVTLLDSANTALDSIKAEVGSLDTKKIRIIENSQNEASTLEPCSFDFLFAFNTLYETSFEALKENLSSKFNLLRKDGFFYLTLVSTKNSGFGVGEEIEPNTFLSGGRKLHFCDAAEIVTLFKQLEIIDIRDEEQETEGSFHWHILGRNRNLFSSEDD